MSPQAFALRPIELCDLPTLKRWRAIPAVQSHLRHPIPPTWPQHLAWWWRTKHDPSCRVFAVTLNDELVGQAGWYYRRGTVAEVSLVVMDGYQECFATEGFILRHLLHPEAKTAGLTVLFAEVLATAPIKRHTVFPADGVVAADTYSTLYRWSIP